MAILIVGGQSSTGRDWRAMGLGLGISGRVVESSFVGSSQVVDPPQCEATLEARLTGCGQASGAPRSTVMEHGHAAPTVWVDLSLWGPAASGNEPGSRVCLSAFFRFSFRGLRPNHHPPALWSDWSTLVSSSLSCHVLGNCFSSSSLSIFPILFPLPFPSLLHSSRIPLSLPSRLLPSRPRSFAPSSTCRVDHGRVRIGGSPLQICPEYIS